MSEEAREQFMRKEFLEGLELYELEFHKDKLMKEISSGRGSKFRRNQLYDVLGVIEKKKNLMDSVVYSIESMA